MVKHYCDISKKQVRLNDLYTISLTHKETGKSAIKPQDISPDVKELIKEFLLSLTVNE
jgi:hypothetical protein